MANNWHPNEVTFLGSTFFVITDNGGKIMNLTLTRLKEAEAVANANLETLLAAAREEGYRNGLEDGTTGALPSLKMGS